jgi:hypothetical protein
MDKKGISLPPAVNEKKIALRGKPEKSKIFVLVLKNRGTSRECAPVFL